MKKVIISLCFIVATISGFAQNNVLDGAYVHENAPTLKSCTISVFT
jgi:hypothetical protein